MSIIVALKGQKSRKKIEGVERTATPFVGGKFNNSRLDSEMGFGLLLPGKGGSYFYKLVIPHNLIQSWRAMKLLEEADDIYSGFYYACWNAFNTIPEPVKLEDFQKDRDLLELKQSMGWQIEKRDKILASVPTQAELESMIQILQDGGVKVDGWELNQEVKAKRLIPGPLAKKVIRNYKARERTRARWGRETKKPLPPEEGLSNFFKALHLDNFIIGGGIDGYGLDWGHISLKELDDIVKQDSFGSRSGFYLERTEFGPGHEGLSFGKVLKATVQYSNGRYTFISAVYRNGHFYVKTEISKNGRIIRKGRFTVPELRQMLKSA